MESHVSSWKDLEPAQHARFEILLTWCKQGLPFGGVDAPRKIIVISNVAFQSSFGCPDLAFFESLFKVREFARLD